MLSKHDSETLMRVGPGTPMGELMRHYWIPALKSSELKAGGDPVRLKLLCEQLIAFRDSSGGIGVFDHRCPHRNASLFFGRNEQGGIRCVYHGWKYDIDGACLEQANVPPHQQFKQKIRATAYKAAERNGMVWVYMGKQSDIPALPDIEATLMPEQDMLVMWELRECNWLQSLEGDIDTSHFDFLHRGGETAAEFAANDPERFGALRRDPEYKVTDTELGTMYGAYRPAEEDTYYWRVAHFMFPFWTFIPNRPLSEYIVARAWVPLDDEHCMNILWMDKKSWTAAVGPIPAIFTEAMNPCLPNTTDWLGRYRYKANKSNDYLIDRELQRTRSFTGVAGINLQDKMVTEAMGTFLDRSLEHLAPSDRMVGETRRRLLMAALALDKDKTPPPGCDRPDLYFNARSGYYVAPQNRDWLEIYNEQMNDLSRSVMPSVARAAE